MVSKDKSGRCGGIPGCLFCHEEPGRALCTGGSRSDLLKKMCPIWQYPNPPAHSQGVLECVRIVQTGSKEKHRRSGGSALPTRHLVFVISSECPQTAGPVQGDISKCHICLSHCQKGARAAQASVHDKAKDPLGASLSSLPAPDCHPPKSYSNTPGMC